MRTIKTKVYEFNELCEAEKEKALSSLAYIYVEDEWWNSTYEDAARIGLQIDGFDLDRRRHATGCFNLSAVEVAQNVLNEHGAMCETYKTAEDFLNDHNLIFADYMSEDSPNYESAELDAQLVNLESEFLKSLLEDYSIMLQNEYEYLTSEAAIIEAIEANEYEFTEDGSLV